MSLPYTVYRHYDKEGILLYVGRTWNLGQRTDAHKHSAWFRLIRRIDVEHFETKRESVEDEKRLIDELKPRYNTDYDGRIILKAKEEEEKQRKKDEYEEFKNSISEKMKSIKDIKKFAKDSELKIRIVRDVMAGVGYEWDYKRVEQYLYEIEFQSPASEY